MLSNPNAPEHLDAHAVAAYLDGRLPAPDVATVESHLAGCEECRREVVELERVMRAPRVTRRTYVLGVAAAAALLIIALPQTRAVFRGGEERTLSDSLLSQLHALGRVTQAPVYLGVSVRGTSEEGAQLFAEAMRTYTSARYADAAAELRRARAAGVDGPVVPFFIGASLLMIGDAAGADEELQRVIAMGESLYLPEARYYRAKALLVLSRPDEAARELDLSASGGGPVGAMAGSLQDSVRSLLAR